MYSFCPLPGFASEIIPFASSQKHSHFAPPPANQSRRALLGLTHAGGTMPKRSSKADASSPVRHIEPKYAAGATC